MRENVVVKDIKEYLETHHNATIFKYHGSAYGVKGHPDLYGFLPNGQALFIEVKAPGKKLMPHQQVMIDYLQERGAISFWADSVEKVKQRLELSTGQK